jgi:hypothetical protein
VGRRRPEAAIARSSRARVTAFLRGAFNDRPILRLDQLAALLGMLGAAVFGGLFLAYNEFYVGMGISPEDVGVSYLYVLSRSIALGALLLIGVVYGAVPVLANPKGEAEPDGRKSAWNGVLLGVLSPFRGLECWQGRAGWSTGRRGRLLRMSSSSPDTHSAAQIRRRCRVDLAVRRQRVDRPVIGLVAVRSSGVRSRGDVARRAVGRVGFQNVALPADQRRSATNSGRA